MRPGCTDSVFIRIFDVNRVTINTNWNTPNVRSSYWRLYVNNRAGAELVLEDQTYALDPHRIHFVPAWVHFSCRNRCEIDHFYVHFDVVGISGTGLRQVFRHPASVDHDAVSRTLVEAVSAGLSTRSNHGHADPDVLTSLPTDDAKLTVLLRAKALVHLCLAKWINSLAVRDRTRLESAVWMDSPVAPALNYIEAHLADDLSNSFLSRLCHLSTDHFIRVFGRTIGQTPAAYVVERRLAHAAQQLVFTSRTIEAIAEEVGFANRHHFSRLFAKHVGMPPVAYRTTRRV